MKEILRRLFGLSVSRTVSPGFNFGNLNFRLEGRYMSAQRAGEALRFALSKQPLSVLDVGSGGGFHARCFSEAGAMVTCVDYGTSVYAENADYDKNIKVLNGDFNSIPISAEYDLVWASHVLEHQRNPGVFIDKLVSCCKQNGIVVITVPCAHRRLLGGHLTLWSPGLLAYNVVLSGVDLSDAIVIKGKDEFSLVFSLNRISLPDTLTFDKHDIEKLKDFLPSFVVEGGDQFASE